MLAFLPRNTASTPFNPDNTKIPFHAPTNPRHAPCISSTDMAHHSSKLALIALVAGSLATTACQSPTKSAQQTPPPPPPAPRSNAQIFPTDFVAANTRTSPPERFEFARRDAELNLRLPAPLTASREWPQSPRPLERRIIFRWWEQN